eukprot:2168035-Pyramimonas_sp.AAC.3
MPVWSPDCDLSYRLYDYTVAGHGAALVSSPDCDCLTVCMTVLRQDTVLYSLATRDPAQVLKHKDEVTKAMAELCADDKFRKLLVSQSKVHK